MFGVTGSGSKFWLYHSPQVGGQSPWRHRLLGALMLKQGSSSTLRIRVGCRRGV